MTARKAIFGEFKMIGNTNNAGIMKNNNIHNCIFKKCTNNIKQFTNYLIGVNYLRQFSHVT